MSAEQGNLRPVAPANPYEIIPRNQKKRFNKQSVWKKTESH